MHSHRMGYFGRIAGFAFQRSLLRTDVLAAVLTALAPVVYFLAGRDIPEKIALYISMLVAAMVLGVLILRVLTAPYFIWKEDQAEIARLREALGDPKERARRALEAEAVNSRQKIIKFLTHHTIWKAFHDGIGGVADYTDVNGVMAHLCLEDPELAAPTAEFEAAHDSFLKWVREAATQEGVALHQVRNLPNAAAYNERYRRAATELYRRVALKT